MNSPQVTLRKRFAFATAIVFAVAIMITIPFNGSIPPFTVVAQQQEINSNTPSPTTTSSNPLPLNRTFKQVENSVVQITSKTPTTGASNPPSSYVPWVLDLSMISKDILSPMVT
ncbi:MAG: hypothetical protein WBZ36_00470 [Candidatus Nitrosopolaris sp.]